MPRVLQIGARMGTSSVIAATGPRKHPMKSIRRFASSRKTQGVWVNERTPAATAPVRVPGDGRHHEKAHHDHRDHPREEQLPDRDAGEHAVDDEGERGRYDGPDGG